VKNGLPFSSLAIRLPGEECMIPTLLLVQKQNAVIADCKSIVVEYALRIIAYCVCLIARASVCLSIGIS
jgi:hypothetical protein